jgi:hypothetical protein
METDTLPSAEFYEEKAAALYQLSLEASSHSARQELLMLAIEFQTLAERARRLGRAETDSDEFAT